MNCQGCVEKECKDGLYIGETARSVGEWMSEHLLKYETKEKTPFFTNTY